MKGICIPDDLTAHLRVNARWTEDSRVVAAWEMGHGIWGGVASRLGEPFVPFVWEGADRRLTLADGHTRIADAIRAALDAAEAIEGGEDLVDEAIAVLEQALEARGVTLPLPAARDIEEALHRALRGPKPSGSGE
jgi:hypothetical protein